MPSDGASASDSKLAEFISTELIRHAQQITEAWLAELARKSLAEGTQSTGLGEQIPEMVRDIADFIRSPSDSGRAAVIGRLRLHADRRREQGSDVQQLLNEFEILSRVVFNAFVDAVNVYEGTSASIEVARLAGRLREALMEITSDGVGIYRKRELERNAELARRLSAFASVITHELKNPLGAAQAGAQMLREKDVVASADQQETFIKLVLRNLVRVHDLIDEIRGLALATGGEAGERHAWLPHVVEKVLAELCEAAAKKDVALEIEGDIPQGCVDAFRAEIVLVNLIGNAIKYSDAAKHPRWVRVSVAPAKMSTGEPGWAITIRDNGLGIPKAAQTNVFRRHFRAHPTVAEGTGLGLAITQEMTTAGGGRIAFESEEGVGSTFRVVFPDRQPDADARDPGEPRSSSRKEILEVSSHT